MSIITLGNVAHDSDERTRTEARDHATAAATGGRAAGGRTAVSRTPPVDRGVEALTRRLRPGRVVRRALAGWPARFAARDAPYVGRDEAEVRDLAKRVADAEADLRRSEERLHELRATVSGIGATYRLLRERHDDLSGDLRRRLEASYDAELGRLERLLRSDKAAVVPIDVAPTLAPLLEVFRARGTAVVWRPAEGPESPVAWGRADDLVEIVHVLLSNAVRHAAGSEVTVSITTSTGRVHVCVSDDGAGVDDDVAEEIFRRGVKGPRSPGQGLGLCVARGLAREMHGDLRLEKPSTGRGARFTLTLPDTPEDGPCMQRPA